jgi:hypothetical protein
MNAVANFFGALRAIPSLPLAACKGLSDLFNGDTVEDIAEAIAICHRCPELLPCRRYSQTLSATQIHGVIGGEYREWLSHPSLRRARKCGQSQPAQDDAAAIRNHPRPAVMAEVTEAQRKPQQTKQPSEQIQLPLQLTREAI